MHIRADENGTNISEKQDGEVCRTWGTQTALVFHYITMSRGIQYTFFKDKIFIKRDEIEHRNYAVTSTCASFFSEKKKRRRRRRRNYIRVVTRNNPQTESKAFRRKMKNSVAF